MPSTSPGPASPKQPLPGYPCPLAPRAADSTTGPQLLDTKPCATTIPWTFSHLCSRKWFTHYLPLQTRNRGSAGGSLLAKTTQLVKSGSRIARKDPALCVSLCAPRPPTCRPASLRGSMLGDGTLGADSAPQFLSVHGTERAKEVWSRLPAYLSQAGLLVGSSPDSAGLRGSPKRADPLSVPLFPDG